MKRIILSLSMLLMLAQNGFAETDAELDKMIADAPNEVWKQIYRCTKASNPHSRYMANVNTCLKVIGMKEKVGGFSKSSFAMSYVNIGILYEYSEKNYIKAYEYYMKAAKLGNTTAQRNLDILCREHSWACK